MRHSGLFFALCWLTATSCALRYHYDDYTRLSESDASSDAANSFGGGGGTFPGGGGSSGDAGGDAQARTPYYVSPAGNDQNDGLSPNSPKLTIAAGLAAAKNSTQAAEVRVCKGTYTEADLLLDVPVSLLGGFDCSAFQRTSSYGFPDFDGVNETVIQAPESSTSGIGLHITGGAIGRGVSVDGFTVAAPTTSSVPTRGIVVDVGASPSISNCIIRGGGGSSGTGVGSVGVAIVQGSAPELSLSQVFGGSGIGAGLDDAAVLVNQAGVVSIHDTRLGGGTNPNGVVGTAGLFLDHTSVLESQGGRISGNYIHGGGGPKTSRGVLVAGGSVDLSGNQIDAGNGGTSVSAGVYLESVTAATLGRNRIYGGDVVPGGVLAAAIYSNQTSSLTIENNFIYGGNRNAVDQVTVVVGITVNNGPPAIIHHNTIFGGPSPMSINTSAIIGSVGQVIENNILYGDGLSETALPLTVCANDGAIQKLRNNAIFGFLKLVEQPAGCPPFAFDTISSVEFALPNACTATTNGECQSFGGTQASGNLRLASSCPATEGAACAVLAGCDGNEGCGAGLFLGYQASDHGFSAFASYQSFSLKTPAPCAISKGGIDLGATVDLFDTPRTPPPSIGAFESDGACN